MKRASSALAWRTPVQYGLLLNTKRIRPRRELYLWLCGKDKMPIISASLAHCNFSAHEALNKVALAGQAAKVRT